MSKLNKIRDAAQSVVTAIAAALSVEVAVIDMDSNLVATSKAYVERKGSSIYKPYIDSAFKEKVVICSNPGYFRLCAKCRLEGQCPLTAEVMCTIDLDGETVGIVTMVAFDEEQRYHLLGNTETLLEFIKEMGNLLVSKIREKEAMERILQTHRLIETTLDSVNDGIITFNQEGQITHANKVACRLFGKQSSSLNGTLIDKLLPEKNLLESIKSGKSIPFEEYIAPGPEHVHCLISTKPINVDGNITGAVLSLTDIRDIRSVVNDLAGMRGNSTFAAIVGDSDLLHEVKQMAMQMAKSDSTILIQAESGTGKELFARAIHTASPRATGPFIALNCAAIPEMLLESELFGYDDGAFTGAKRGGKPGKFELADGGTLFLDEIGDMPLHLQSKLLRVLQDQEVQRVGGTRTIALNVRIIAATNQDLESKVKTREFRNDLFFRLSVIPLSIPPLRERAGDIMVLSRYFLDKYNQKLKKNIEGFTFPVIEILQHYNWPGNVRELENSIEYAVNVENETFIRQTSLPRRILGLLSGNKHPNTDTSLAERIHQYEYSQIVEALGRYGWGLEGKHKAAQELGISLPTLYRKLNEKVKTKKEIYHK